MVVSRVMTSCAPSWCAAKRVRRREKPRVASQQEVGNPLIMQMLNDVNEQFRSVDDVTTRSVRRDRDVIAVEDALQDLNANRHSMLRDYVTDQMLRTRSQCSIHTAHERKRETRSRQSDVTRSCRRALSFCDVNDNTAWKVYDLESHSSSTLSSLSSSCSGSSYLTSVTSDVTPMRRRSSSGSSSSDDVSVRDVQQFVEFVRYQDSCRKRRNGRRRLRRSDVRTRKFTRLLILQFDQLKLFSYYLWLKLA